MLNIGKNEAGDEMMRAIRRFFLLFFIIIIGGPIAIGGLSLVKDANLPEFYETMDYTEYDPQQEIKDEVFSNFIHVIADSSDTIQMTIDQETVNKAIFAEMKGFSTPEYSQIFISNNQVVTVKGIWTELIGNHVAIYTLIEYQGITTTLTLSMDVEKAQDELKLSLNNFKVGKIPIPQSIIKYLINNFAPSIIEDYYQFGDINYDELYVTILSKYYEDAISEYTQGIASLKSIGIDHNKLILNFTLDEENEQAMLIQDTLEVVRELTQDDQIDHIVDSLDDNVATEKAFKDDFTEAMSIVDSYLSDPENAELAQVDEDLFMSLNTTFENLPQEKQNEVAQELESIINNIDSTLLNDLRSSIDDINIEEFTTLTDIFFGVTLDQ